MIISPGSSDGLDVRRFSGQAVEISDGDAAGGLIGAEQLDAGLQDGHRDGHVRGMGGDAGVARAEDGVHAVDAADGGAARAGIALVAVGGRVVEVGAAGALQQVAADGRLVAQLAGSAGDERLGEDGVTGAHAEIGGDVGVCGLGADAQAAVGEVFGIFERQAADVDQVGGPLDLELHQIEQVGAAANELCAAAGHGGDGGLQVRCALVGEGPHLRTPSATSRMAATMFG